MRARGPRSDGFEGDGVYAQADVIVGHLDERGDRAQELAERSFLKRESALSRCIAVRLTVSHRSSQWSRRCVSRLHMAMIEVVMLSPAGRFIDA